MSRPVEESRLQWDDRCVAVLLSGMVILTSWQILARHVGPVMPLPEAMKTASYTEELGRYLFIWAMLVGTVAAFRRNEHLSLDLWHSAPGVRTVLRLVRRMAWVAFSGLLAVGGVRLLILQWNTSQTTTMGWPVVWVTASVPVVGVWLLLSALFQRKPSEP